MIVYNSYEHLQLTKIVCFCLFVGVFWCVWCLLWVCFVLFWGFFGGICCFCCLFLFYIVLFCFVVLFCLFVVFIGGVFYYYSFLMQCLNSFCFGSLSGAYSFLWASINIFILMCKKCGHEHADKRLHFKLKYVTIKLSGFSDIKCSYNAHCKHNCSFVYGLICCFSIMLHVVKCLQNKLYEICRYFVRFKYSSIYFLFSPGL